MTDTLLTAAKQGVAHELLGVLSKDSQEYKKLAADMLSEFHRIVPEMKPSCGEPQLTVDTYLAESDVGTTVLAIEETERKKTRLLTGGAESMRVTLWRRAARLCRQWM